SHVYGPAVLGAVDASLDALRRGHEHRLVAELQEACRAVGAVEEHVFGVEQVLDGRAGRVHTAEGVVADVYRYVAAVPLDGDGATELVPADHRVERRQAEVLVLVAQEGVAGDLEAFDLIGADPDEVVLEGVVADLVAAAGVEVDARLPVGERVARDDGADHVVLGGDALSRLGGAGPDEDAVLDDDAVSGDLDRRLRGTV